MKDHEQSLDRFQKGARLLVTAGILLTGCVSSRQGELQTTRLSIKNDRFSITRLASTRYAISSTSVFSWQMDEDLRLGIGFIKERCHVELIASKTFGWGYREVSVSDADCVPELRLAQRLS